MIFIDFFRNTTFIKNAGDRLGIVTDNKIFSTCKILYVTGNFLKVKNLHNNTIEVITKDSIIKRNMAFYCK